MNNGLVRFTKRLLDMMFYAGIILTIMIPVAFHYVGFYIEVYRKYYIPQCVIYMISGVFCIRIVYELRKMFITVLNEDAFVDSNVVSLKVMSKCAFLIGAMSVVRLPLSPTPATIVILIVFSVAGLFSIVLAQVFGEAIRYKQENDLTI